MTSDPHPRVFGYGSLVNTATHTYEDARPAVLAGWRREWRSTALREVAYLSAYPDPGGAIEGLTAAVPGRDWAALDARERAYRRHDVTDRIEVGAAQVSVYSVEAGALDGSRHPILLSYLDTVVQGYLRVFGEDGARRFFDTTDGWEAAVLDDRGAPIYPRAQVLRAKERAFVDTCLAARPVAVIGKS